jgi:hypothetical protein
MGGLWRTCNICWDGLNPRTTRFYDRRKKKVTRNIVERISV